MGRGRRAGLDGLFIFKAGLPQMYMHIHQPGAHGQSPGIDHPGVGLVDVAPDDRYLSVLNQHIPPMPPTGSTSRPCRISSFTKSLLSH